MPLTLKEAADRIGFESPRTVLQLAQRAKRVADRGGLPVWGYQDANGQWLSGVFKAGGEWRVEERAIEEFKRAQMIKSRSANQRPPVLAETASEILARLRAGITKLPLSATKRFAEPTGASLPVGENDKSPEGPGWDGYEPLMRNRAMRSPQGITGSDTFHSAATS